jgi:hypothetical protein
MRDTNTPVSPIDWSSKQKINKEIPELNHSINQMDLADVYRKFHPTGCSWKLMKMKTRPTGTDGTQQRQS